MYIITCCTYNPKDYEQLNSILYIYLHTILYSRCYRSSILPLMMNTLQSGV